MLNFKNAARAAVIAGGATLASFAANSQAVAANCTWVGNMLYIGDGDSEPRHGVRMSDRRDVTIHFTKHVEKHHWGDAAGTWSVRWWQYGQQRIRDAAACGVEFTAHDNRPFAPQKACDSNQEVNRNRLGSNQGCSNAPSVNQNTGPIVRRLDVYTPTPTP